MVTIKGLDAMPGSCSRCRFCAIKDNYALGYKSRILYCNAMYLQIEETDGFENRADFCPLQEKKILWSSEEGIITPIPYQAPIPKQMQKQMQKQIEKKVMEKMIGNTWEWWTSPENNFG